MPPRSRSPLDSQPWPDARLEDLDEEAVRRYLEARTPPGLEPPAEPWTEVLWELGFLVRKGRRLLPTLAALLLFGRRPQRLLPHAAVKAARFKGRDISSFIVDSAEIGGTVDRQIEAAVQFVVRNMRMASVIEGVYRREIPEYPLPAVREAITNAVLHRDYGRLGEKVRILMFDDRLEVWSPGGLAGPVTLETLEVRRYSRNPRLAQAMYELRLVEEMGTGIRRIRRALAELGSPPPTFLADDVSFTAVLPAHPLEAAPAPKGESTPERPAGVDRRLWAALSPRQRRGLLHALREGRITNRAYRQACGEEISDEVARRDLQDLVRKGLLFRVGDKRGTYYVPKV